MSSTMQRARVNGVELEYDSRGSGEPVILIHGGLLADENSPLLHEPGLTDSYRVVNYHRRGFAGSEHPDGKAQITDQVADCLALMDELGIDRAHVVGHSLGGTISMQLALTAPERVNDLSLMEPAIMAAFAKQQAAAHGVDAAGMQAQFMEGMQNVNEIYRSGDVRGALQAFLETRAGDAFRGVLDWLTTTGEFDQAVRDAGTFLEIEMPAAYAWDFTPDDAKRIQQPVLSILGAHSPERAQQVHKVLTQWVPHTELVTLPNAEHALPLMDPPGIAKVLAEYFAAHPIDGKA
jgi:pimeloyl-ACP methyl ester carboxylesterase